MKLQEAHKSARTAPRDNSTPEHMPRGHALIYLNPTGSWADVQTPRGGFEQKLTGIQMRCWRKRATPPPKALRCPCERCLLYHNHIPALPDCPMPQSSTTGVACVTEHFSPSHRFLNNHAEVYINYKCSANDSGLLPLSSYI